MFIFIMSKCLPEVGLVTRNKYLWDASILTPYGIILSIWENSFNVFKNERYSHGLNLYQHKTQNFSLPLSYASWASLMLCVCVCVYAFTNFYVTVKPQYFLFLSTITPLLFFSPSLPHIAWTKFRTKIPITKK